MWAEAVGRAAVAARSGGVCETCGNHPGVHWHHRVLRSQGGTWNPANGLWVCALSHNWIHDNPSAARKLGWLLDGGDDPQVGPVYLVTPYAAWWRLFTDGPVGDPRSHLREPLDPLDPETKERL